jgi:hypothetical protein
MKVFWIAVLLCIGALLVLALAQPEDPPGDPSAPSIAGNNPLHGFPPVADSDLISGHYQTGTGNKTALFSKYVAPGTRYIVVSLYSGDIADPISVTIITPDMTLGPFYDESDGVVNGRIDLKISNPENITPGLWKFLVHSNKNISYGSLENLSWIRTGTYNHKADEFIRNISAS